MRFTESETTVLRAALMKKGQSVATTLAEVLANKGKKVDMVAFPERAKKPGLRPEERLRLFLDHIEGCRKQLDADDDGYGRCRHCGADIGIVALREMPWADVCEEHAAEG